MSERGNALLRRLVPAVLAAGLAAAAPAAAGATRLTAATDLRLGPALAGEGLLYGELFRGSVRVTLARPNRPRSRLLAGPVPRRVDHEDDEPGGYTIVTSDIAASPERLVYASAFASGNARYQQGITQLDRFAGDLETGFDTLEECTSNNPSGPASTSVDADGARVATTDCAGRIEIRSNTDFPDDVVRVDPGAGLAVGQLALAGRYVAYNSFALAPGASTPGTTVVHDWVAGTKLYEVPRQSSFDLQADGKLAAASVPSGTDSCTQGKLAWYSPAEPTEHVLPVVPCDENVRIAGDRVAAVTRSDSQRVLALVALDGTRADAARFGGPGMQRGRHDFDGTRVAYALGNCLGGADLHTGSAAISQPPPAPSPACPMRVSSRSAPVGPANRGFPLYVQCELGCAADVLVRMQVRGRMRTVGERRVRIAPEDPCADLGTALAVELSSAARSELRRRRRANVRVTLTGTDRTGDPRSVSETVRLRAARSNRPPSGECSA